ncbi:MAG: DUF5378 family protein [Metamycoplasmataceae bacterium]
MDIEANLGFYLAVFTFFSIIGILFFSSKLGKIFNNYYVMAFSGIIFFVYFWVIRYHEDVTNLINGTFLINGEHSNNLEANTGNIRVSKAFLLDLCPFIALLISIMWTFDRERAFLKVLAPYAFFGGVVTIFGQISQEGVGASNNLYVVTTSWDFIFGNEGYFLMHYFSIIFGLIILMNSKGFGLYGIGGAVAFPMVYFSYVMIIVTQFNVTQNATGLVEGDWTENGQYATVWKIFGELPFPYITILCYSLVAVYIFLWIYLRNILIFENKWKHLKMIAFPRLTTSIRGVVNKMNQGIYNI